MNVIDNTAKAPAQYRVRNRKPGEITTIVLHAMGFVRKPTNPRWAMVKAHYCIRRDGSILMNHHPTVRMKYGSGVANRYSITIEHEGNPVNEHGKAFKPEKFGVHAATPEQVASSRALMAALCAEYPSIRFVSSHRHIDAGKSNCPGPELWRECGEWAIAELGLHEAPVLKGGLVLPDTWRGVPSVATVHNADTCDMLGL